MWWALAAYVLLAAVAYVTLDGVFRLAVWIIVGGLAIRTAVRGKYEED